jgi:hypothetical protein
VLWAAYSRARECPNGLRVARDALASDLSIHLARQIHHTSMIGLADYLMASID